MRFPRKKEKFQTNIFSKSNWWYLSLRSYLIFQGSEHKLIVSWLALLIRKVLSLMITFFTWNLATKLAWNKGMHIFEMLSFAHQDTQTAWRIHVFLEYTQEYWTWKTSTILRTSLEYVWQHWLFDMLVPTNSYSPTSAFGVRTRSLVGLHGVLKLLTYRVNDSLI